MYNQKMYQLGSKRSTIREIFEYAKKRRAEIGDDKVFDFSIGNPSVEPPKEIAEAIVDLVNNAKDRPTWAGPFFREIFFLPILTKE